MKTSALLIVAGLLCIYAVADDRSEKTSQIERLFKESQAFLDSKQYRLAFGRCIQIRELDPFSIAALRQQEKVKTAAIAHCRELVAADELMYPTFPPKRLGLHIPKSLPLPSPVQCIAADLTSKDAYRQFVVRKDYEGGVAAFTQEIAAHPSDVRLLLGVAQLHLSFIRYAEARAAFERALVLDPTNMFAHNNLAIVLSQQGHPTDALRHLELALKANPDYGDAHFNRAVILATNRPPDKPAARESYKRALALGCEPDKELEKLIE